MSHSRQHKWTIPQLAVNMDFDQDERASLHPGAIELAISSVLLQWSASRSLT